LTTVFSVVSDLHLSEATPGITALFLDYLADLRELAGKAGNSAAKPALYLLGDIFEYWAGDDDLVSPLHAKVCAALRQTTEAGIETSFIAGNRDFLIGPDFAKASGVRLLPDPYILSLPAWQFALSHGDQFCTDDLPYQQFRQMVRAPAWQAQFLAQPLVERKRQIEAIRQQSEANKQGANALSADLMDVNPAEIADFFHHHGYPTLIHGHTHRPMKHDYIVDGIHCERWVLADWKEAGTPSGRPFGEALNWDGENLTRIRC
jgi:UDP-2,3-diacylglucosamine hydrolase